MRPPNYPFHRLIETYRSWGEDPGLWACLSGRPPGGFAAFVRSVLRLKMLDLYDARGDFEEGLQVARRVLREAQTAGLIQGQIQALFQLCAFHGHRSEYLQMKESAEQAWELCLQKGHLKGQAEAMNHLARVEVSYGNYPQAQALFERANFLYRRIGHQDGVATSLHNLANLFMDEGDLERAQKNSEEALKIREAIGDLREQAFSWETLGIIQGHKGDLSQAIADQEHARSLFQTAGDREGVAYVLTNLGVYESRLGNFSRALECLNEAHGLFTVLGNPSGQGRALTYQGRAFQALGLHLQAAGCQREAVAIRRNIGERREEAQSQADLALTLLEMKDHAGARKALEEAQFVVAQGQATDNELLCLLSRGSGALALETGVPEKARQEFEDGLKRAEDMDSKRHRASLLAIRARLNWKVGDLTKAQEDFQEALSLFGSLGEKAELSKAGYDFGLALLAHGEEEKGRWYLGEARRLFEAIGAEGWLKRMDLQRP
jgi:tetratricopeptide (TPR) repeat protein